MSEHSLQLTHQFRGKLARVYRAWTNPSELAKWFGPVGYTKTVLEFDLRVGGAYRFEMQNPEGNSAYLTGTYQTILPEEKLVYTWRWEDWGQEIEDSLVTVEFHDRGDATEIVVTHEKLAHEAAVAGQKYGWTSTLEGSLQKYLEQEGLV